MNKNMLINAPSTINSRLCRVPVAQSSNHTPQPHSCTSNGRMLGIVETRYHKYWQKRVKELHVVLVHTLGSHIITQTLRRQLQSFDLRIIRIQSWRLDSSLSKLMRQKIRKKANKSNGNKLTLERCIATGITKIIFCWIQKPTSTAMG